MSLADSFGKTGFARHMNSPVGRVARVVVGGGLVIWGYLQRDSAVGMALMVIGLVPFAAGVFNWCLISALLGGPINGNRVGR